MLSSPGGVLVVASQRRRVSHASLRRVGRARRGILQLGLTSEQAGLTSLIAAAASLRACRLPQLFSSAPRAVIVVGRRLAALRRVQAGDKTGLASF